MERSAIGDKMTILKYMNALITAVLVFIGLFGVLVISHEAYHFISIKGEPTGICFGKCLIPANYSGNSSMTWATSAISWQLTTEQQKNLNANIEAEEAHAWIFSMVITIIVGIFKSRSL